MQRVQTRLCNSLDKAGVAATEAKKYDLALQWFTLEEKRNGKLSTYGPIYQSAAFIAKGDHGKGLEILYALDTNITTDGRGLETIEKLREFDGVCRDSKFIKIVENWAI